MVKIKRSARQNHRANLGGCQIHFPIAARSASSAHKQSSSRTMLMICRVRAWLRQLHPPTHQKYAEMTAMPPNTFTHPTGKDPSWTVKLSSFYPHIFKVELVNRHDCCPARLNGVSVYLDDLLCGQIHDAGISGIRDSGCPRILPGCQDHRFPRKCPRL